MPRFKEISQNNIMVPINLKDQLLPGTFEFTINEVIDNHLDLTFFNDYYDNDKAGQLAYNPAVLLKIILFAYSKGILSSRKIEKACKTNIIFMALSGESTPDHSTIATFISTRSSSIKKIFVEILAICHQLDLIGLDYLAVDGCKIPSNASKEHSGTFPKYKNKIKKLEKKIDKIIWTHSQNDSEETVMEKENVISKIKKECDRIQDFLNSSSPREGKNGNEIISNITDNQSAKLKTSSGHIQGYNGLAIADKKNQIILNASPIGKQYEGDSLTDFYKETLDTAKDAKILKKHVRSAILLADTNYYSEDNCEFMLKKQKIDAVIPDNNFRQRDHDFPTRTETHKKMENRKFTLADFQYDKSEDFFTCPGKKKLFLYSHVKSGRYKGKKYRIDADVCSSCPLKENCLRKNKKRRTIYIPGKNKIVNYSEKMKKIIDSPEGRLKYSKRMGIIEPVFANIKNKGMNHFTMRSLEKIRIQWFYFCIVHNLEKICTTGAINKLCCS